MTPHSVSEYKKIVRAYPSIAKQLRNIDEVNIVEEYDGMLVTDQKVSAFGKSFTVCMDSQDDVFMSVGSSDRLGLLCIFPVKSKKGYGVSVSNLFKYIKGTTSDQMYTPSYIHETTHMNDLKKGRSFEESDVDTVSLCQYIENPYEYKAVLYEACFILDKIYRITRGDVEDRSVFTNIAIMALEEYLSFGDGSTDHILDCVTRNGVFGDDLYSMFLEIFNM